MKSMTIHKLDADTSLLLGEEAARQGVSLGQCVKNILSEEFGLDEPTEPDWTEELLPLCGRWTREQAEEFEQNTKAFGMIDEEMWK